MLSPPWDTTRAEARPEQVGLMVPKNSHQAIEGRVNLWIRRQALNITRKCCMGMAVGCTCHMPVTGIATEALVVWVERRVALGTKAQTIVLHSMVA